jgi:hypothetical protein
MAAISNLRLLLGFQGPFRCATGDPERRPLWTSVIVGPQGYENIKPEHIAQAIGYRPPDQDDLLRVAARLSSW